MKYKKFIQALEKTFLFWDCNRLLREVVEAAFLEMFKIHLDITLRKSFSLSLLERGF